jgi:choline-glycine betaine transporter
MQSFPEPSGSKRPSWYGMVNGISHAVPKVLLLSSPFMLILLFMSLITIQELRQDLKKLNHDYHLLQKSKQHSHSNPSLKVPVPARAINSPME